MSAVCLPLPPFGVPKKLPVTLSPTPKNAASLLEMGYLLADHYLDIKNSDLIVTRSMVEDFSCQAKRLEKNLKRAAWNLEEEKVLREFAGRWVKKSL